MRRRRQRRWLLPLTVCAGVLTGQGARGQDRPPPLPSRAADPSRFAGTPAATLSELLAPPAPEPIPGPASTGLPRGGMNAPTPRGLPINLATAL